MEEEEASMGRGLIECPHKRVYPPIKQSEKLLESLHSKYTIPYYTAANVFCVALT